MRTTLPINAAKIGSVISYDPETGAFRWKVKVSRKIRIGSIAGSINSDGYRQIKICGCSYQAHRLAWVLVHGTIPNGMEIDHINNVRSDNRMKNLRLATTSQNRHNSKLSANNKSGVKGVHFYKQTKRWKASVRCGGKAIHLGYFRSKGEAETAVRRARVEIHGEYANHGEE